MTILFKLKKEYEETIENLLKAAKALNKVIDLNKRLRILSYNKDTGFKPDTILSNNESLERIQNDLDILIEQIEVQLIRYIFDSPEEIEDVDVFVDNMQNLSFIFNNDTET